MTTVAVLYGGISAEREVSLSSGGKVIASLREAGFDVVPVEVGQDIAAMMAALDPKPDVVFNALHGRFGEDGVVQGVLDWMGIPYTHSGMRASALAMDKAASRAVFAAAGLPVAQGRMIEMEELDRGDPMPRPYVIKPLNEGSSVGVQIVREGGNHAHAIAAEWSFGPQALVEEFVPGRELTVGVLEDQSLRLRQQIRGGRIAPRAAGGSAPGGGTASARSRLGRASRAGLSRCHPRRFPLRRHVG